MQSSATIFGPNRENKFSAMVHGPFSWPIFLVGDEILIDRLSIGDMTVLCFWFEMNNISW